MLFEPWRKSVLRRMLVRVHPPDKFIRSKLMDDLAAGVCKDEADAIEEALNSNVDKGPWIDLFVSISIQPGQNSALIL